MHWVCSAKTARFAYANSQMVVGLVFAFGKSHTLGLFCENGEICIRKLANGGGFGFRFWEITCIGFVLRKRRGLHTQTRKWWWVWFSLRAVYRQKSIDKHMLWVCSAKTARFANGIKIPAEILIGTSRNPST